MTFEPIAPNKKTANEETLKTSVDTFSKTTEAKDLLGAKIKVIGVGGGGCNAINAMIRAGLKGVEFVAANTDVQALAKNLAPTKIQIGKNLTRGLGAGANPEIGKKSAEESKAEIAKVLDDADMVFITAGLGGGTGTGASPIIAEVAQELGILTVAVVTKPFVFEAPRRTKTADMGHDQLKEFVDTVITIPNQKLLNIAGNKTTVLEAFAKADEVLLNAVRGVSDLINISGHINLDFADVRTVMLGKGMALMGTGIAEGENRAVNAAHMAISSPLLEDISIRGATGIIINITGPENLALHEISEAVSLITEEADEDAEVIFGSVFNEGDNEEVKVTVVATGFPENKVDNIITPKQTLRNTQTTGEIDSSEMMADDEELLEAVTEEIFGEEQAAAAEEIHEPSAQETDSADLSLYQAKKIANEMGLKTIDEEDLEVPAFIRKGIKRK